MSLWSYVTLRAHEDKVVSPANVRMNVDRCALFLATNSTMLFREAVSHGETIFTNEKIVDVFDQAETQDGIDVICG